MDMLDPLETSEEVETKVMLNEIHIKGQAMESDEEGNVIDHLSPQTLLETPGDNDVQYSLRSPEEMTEEEPHTMKLNVRRRDKINNWITRLSFIIPESNPSDIKGNCYTDGQSKGGILAKACEYIMELKDIQERYDTCAKENKQLVANLELAKLTNSVLERENKELKELLKKNGILYVPNELSS
ncbi:hypothetical protein NQ317_005780 [Molorchus minor]|uniref:BHLH domain-containing protein n=1 Tax=Molorchus minor TaxID=1323400 RepID=A0ABQ9JA89_9CUCU|nr:hypothetical protein NQ317_005780 [Molorchus minor]